MQKRRDDLIIKKRTIDYKYIGLEMLYQRLPDEHPMKKVINSKILSAKAGIIGETIVEEVFNKYKFPFNYCVLHDLNLSSNGKFQIDTLFICPYYVVVLECKNIVGELSFEKEPPYLKRELENGQIDGFESPEVQVDRNIYLLGEWLSVRGIDIPVMGVVVFNSTKSKIVNPPDHTSVIYATSIPVFLRRLPREKEYLTLTQMSDLAHSIAKAHQAYFPYPMCKNWRIDPEDLITGVLCGKCGRFGMEKLKAGWYCSSCCNIDRRAHERAIKDWFVLIKDSLTNKECRKFLHLSSYQTSLRILETMNLTRFGDNNKTIYKWNWLEKS